MKPKKIPVIREIALNMALRAMKASGQLEQDIRCFTMGECLILLGTIPDEGLHLSISHPRRYPTWDEIFKVRYELIPDEREMVMHLPRMADYINIHENCFHLHELKKN